MKKKRVKWQPYVAAPFCHLLNMGPQGMQLLADADIIGVEDTRTGAREVLYANTALFNQKMPFRIGTVAFRVHSGSDERAMLLQMIQQAKGETAEQIAEGVAASRQKLGRAG